MALDPYLVLLRELLDPNLTAKGSPLTWTQLDTNMKILVDNIKALMTAGTGGFAAYNNGTTYSNVLPDYVSYNGNIYEYINAVPQSGVTPGNDPLTWQLTSTGLFAHQQNTDEYLAFGQAHQISAIDIYNFINSGQLTPITKTNDYIFAIGDINKSFEFNKAAAIVGTIPLNATEAFPIGTIIYLAQTNAGQLSIAATGGVTLVSADSYTKLRVQNSAAYIQKIGTDTWRLVGDLTA